MNTPAAIAEGRLCEGPLSLPAISQVQCGGAACRAYLEGEPLPVYGDGRNVRDWLHVEDHCRGIESLLERGIIGEVYNIGGQSEFENIALVRMLCAIIDDRLRSTPALRARFPRAAAATGSSSEGLITYVRDRPGHDRRYAIDSRKMQNDCAFAPRISLQAGLSATVDWYLLGDDKLKAGWQRTA